MKVLLSGDCSCEGPFFRVAHPSAEMMELKALLGRTCNCSNLLYKNLGVVDGCHLPLGNYDEMNIQS